MKHRNVSQEARTEKLEIVTRSSNLHKIYLAVMSNKWLIYMATLYNNSIYALITELILT